MEFLTECLVRKQERAIKRELRVGRSCSKLDKFTMVSLSLLLSFSCLCWGG